MASARLIGFREHIFTVAHGICGARWPGAVRRRSPVARTKVYGCRYWYMYLKTQLTHEHLKTQATHLQIRTHLQYRALQNSLAYLSLCLGYTEDDCRVGTSITLKRILRCFLETCKAVFLFWRHSFYLFLIQLPSVSAFSHPGTTNTRRSPVDAIAHHKVSTSGELGECCRVLLSTQMSTSVHQATKLQLVFQPFYPSGTLQTSSVVISRSQ